MSFSLNFPEEDVPILQLIQACVVEEDITAYLVGGYLRDIYLQRPSKDLDIVCLGEGTGLRLARALATRWGKKATCTVFENFGTAQVKHAGYICEFVGARKESYRSHSRKPEVVPGTLSEDLARRDFTCNALAYPLQAFPSGTLIDHFEGLADLKRGCLRTPLAPAQTFSDDPLRMMRAVRFAAQLNFEIAPDALAGIQATASRLKIVSQERITAECNQILMTNEPSQGFLLMLEADLLPEVMPEVLALKGVEIIGKHTHKDNFFHTLKVVDNIARMGAGLWLRWAALLHDIAKPKTKAFDPRVGWTFHGHEERGARMVPGIFRRMRLPTQQMEYVKKLVRLHLRPIALVNKMATDTALRRLLYEAGDTINDLMTLCRADITSKDETKVNRYLTNFDSVEQRMKLVEAKDRLRNFQLPLSGKQIMDTFAIPPSPLVGVLKQAVKEAILDGEIANNEKEAYRFVCEIAKKKGLTPQKNREDPPPNAKD